MAVKIRLQRHGRKQQPYYHIVVADSRARRDGKFIERIGDYNPLTRPATINVDVDKAVSWLQKGAEATNTVHDILKYKGAYLKKHLLRGLAKGVVSAEAVEAKFQEWVDSHKNAVLDHKAKVSKEKQDKVAKLLKAETEKAADRDRKRAEALAAAQTAEAPATEEAIPDAPAAEEAPAE